MNKFGDKIRSERLARGLTQNHVAKEIGVSRSSFPQWEQGNTRRIMAEPFLKLSLFYKLNPFWLWFDKGNKQIFENSKRENFPLFCEKLPLIDEPEYVEKPINIGENLARLHGDLFTTPKEAEKMNATALSELFKVEDKSLLYILKVISTAWKKKDIIEIFDDIIEEATLARENEIALRQAHLKSGNMNNKM
jgi:transcriptional regulator with XRE-family HTH domain